VDVELCPPRPTSSPRIASVPIPTRGVPSAALSQSQGPSALNHCDWLAQASSLFGSGTVAVGGPENHELPDLSLARSVLERLEHTSRNSFSSNVAAGAVLGDGAGRASALKSRVATSAAPIQKTASDLASFRQELRRFELEREAEAKAKASKQVPPESAQVNEVTATMHEAWGSSYSSISHLAKGTSTIGSPLDIGVGIANQHEEFPLAAAAAVAEAVPSTNQLCQSFGPEDVNRQVANFSGGVMPYASCFLSSSKGGTNVQGGELSSEVDQRASDSHREPCVGPLLGRPVGGDNFISNLAVSSMSPGPLFIDCVADLKGDLRSASSSGSTLSVLTGSSDPFIARSFPEGAGGDAATVADLLDEGCSSLGLPCTKPAAENFLASTSSASNSRNDISEPVLEDASSCMKGGIDRPYSSDPSSSLPIPPEPLLTRGDRSSLRDTKTSLMEPSRERDELLRALQHSEQRENAASDRARRAEETEMALRAELLDVRRAAAVAEADAAAHRADSSESHQLLVDFLEAERCMMKTSDSQIDDITMSSLTGLVVKVVAACKSYRSELQDARAREETCVRSVAARPPVRAVKEVLVNGSKLLRLQQAQRALQPAPISAGRPQSAAGNCSRGRGRPLYALPSPRRAGDDAACQLLAEMSQALHEIEEWCRAHA